MVDAQRMGHVEMYTDGSSRGNPGPGGYGAVLRYVDPDGRMHELELHRGYELTTNNRMELMGVIAGLEALKRPCTVTVHTDSKYICDAFGEDWVGKWVANGWRTAGKKPVKNPDLWKRLLAACEGHEVSFEWVKGHAGNELNERCDELATSSADGELGGLTVDEGFEG